MTDHDMVGIVPAEGQTAEDIATVVRKVAADQGFTEEIVIEHDGDQDVVIAPRALMLDSRNMTSFPPKNAPYQTPGHVELIGQNPAGRSLVVIEDWQPTVDHRT